MREDGVESMHFRHYPAERLDIESIVSRLTDPENAFRKWLMDYTIAHGIPFNINGGSFDRMNGYDVQAMAESLVKKRAIVMDADLRVNFIYPVSALPTHHKVFLKDGRSFSAMCAIDAMGAAFTFKQDIRVESKCSECGERVSIEIEGERIAELYPETTHTLHVDLKKVDNWAGSC